MSSSAKADDPANTFAAIFIARAVLTGSPACAGDDLGNRRAFVSHPE
jgi:hypothetical protein